MAIAHTLCKEDFNTAMKYYKKHIYLYRGDPEGYFGLAKMQYATEDYEEALENIFTAHILYVNKKSKFIEESKEWIIRIVAKLKGLDKIEFINKKAKEHNINFN